MTQLICITGQWHNVTQRASGILEQVVCVQQNPLHYQAHPWVPYSFHSLANTQEDAKFLVARTMRILRFMDATGLVPRACGWKPQMGELVPDLPPSATQSMLWQDGLGRWIVTAEPYCIEDAPPASLMRWVQSAGWSLWRADPRSGMWNPDRGGRLLVMAPPASAQGGDAEAVCRALETMPREMHLACCLVPAKTANQLAVSA